VGFRSASPYQGGVLIGLSSSLDKGRPGGVWSHLIGGRFAQIKTMYF